MLEAVLFNILLGTISLPVSGCGGPGCLPIKLCLYICKAVRTLLLERPRLGQDSHTQFPAAREGGCKEFQCSGILNPRI